YEGRGDRPAARRPPVYAPLPPSTGPSKATTYQGRGSNQIEVYLTNDLTLVRRPGHTLLLSPTFTADADGGGPPDSILLRFVSFSHEQVFSDHSALAITADGEIRWPNLTLYSHPTPSDTRARHSATTGEDGQVVETVGETLPYEEFVRIVSARNVTVMLGPDVVELTAEQVEALRDMHRKLPPSPHAPKRTRD
ncbi:MAG TPA: hypothetical protein VF611_21465, partial [Pyrinomonadaceae bacterium]